MAKRLLPKPGIAIVNLAGRPTGLLGERGTVSPAGYLTITGGDPDLAKFRLRKYFETFSPVAEDMPAP